MSSVIIENTKKGNGLISIPLKKSKTKRTSKEIKLYGGMNSVPKVDWESVRSLPIIKHYLKKSVLIEKNVSEVKEPSKDDLSKILSLEDFMEKIATGDLGVKPEQNSHYLVSLDEKVEAKYLPNGVRTFRVKASAEDARLAAYGQYIEKMGGKPTTKIKVKALDDMDIEDVEEIVKETYNPDTLNGWSKSKKESIKHLVTVQKERIEKFEGKKETK
jgi:hypothetical protein